MLCVLRGRAQSALSRRIPVPPSSWAHARVPAAFLNASGDEFGRQTHATRASDAREWACWGDRRQRRFSTHASDDGEGSSILQSVVKARRTVLTDCLHCLRLTLTASFALTGVHRARQQQLLYALAAQAPARVHRQRRDRRCSRAPRRVGDPDERARRRRRDVRDGATPRLADQVSGHDPRRRTRGGPRPAQRRGPRLLEGGRRRAHSHHAAATRPIRSSLPCGERRVTGASSQRRRRRRRRSSPPQVPLELGDIPQLQESVSVCTPPGKPARRASRATLLQSARREAPSFASPWQVVGFPAGGDNLSITSGVVSRVVGLHSAPLPSSRPACPRVCRSPHCCATRLTSLSFVRRTSPSTSTALRIYSRSSSTPPSTRATAAARCERNLGCSCDGPRTLLMCFHL